MKFAFSTVSCPKWDFETIVSRAREYGYDGVEIRGFLNESLLTSANVFVTDPDKVSRTFSAGGGEDRLPRQLHRDGPGRRLLAVLAGHAQRPAGGRAADLH